VKGYKK